MRCLPTVDHRPLWTRSWIAGRRAGVQAGRPAGGAVFGQVGPDAASVATVRASSGGSAPRIAGNSSAASSHDNEARTIAVARHRRRRRSRPLLQRVWSYLEYAAIGYGYRPARALVWLIALTAVVAVVFASSPPRPTQPNGPPFQPVIYALDVVLPILDLHQEGAFVPLGATQWIAWTSSFPGWLLATTTLAGLTRRLTRG